MARHKSRSAKRACPLRLEPLEAREVPRNFGVKSYLDGGPGSGSLRAALLKAEAYMGPEDAVIRLSAGTYTLSILNAGGRQENEGLTGDLDLRNTARRLVIRGAGLSGPSATVIDARGIDRAFQVFPGVRVTFQNLAITDGLAQDDGSAGAVAGTTDARGGGILNDSGNVTLDDVIITDNVARGGNGANGGPGVPGGDGHRTQGGGIYSTGGSLGISGSTIASNQAIGGGGGDGGDSSVYGGGPGGNGGSGQGGGLYSAGAILTLTDASISSNSARGGFGGDGGAGFGSIFGGGGGGGYGGVGQGGGLYYSGGVLTLNNATISRNTARGGDGGVGGNAAPRSANGGPGGGGGQSQGGGLYGSGGMLTLSNVTVSTNIILGGDGGNGGDANPSIGNPGNGGNGGRGQHWRRRRQGRWHSGYRPTRPGRRREE